MVGTDVAVCLYRRALDTGARDRFRGTEAEVLNTRHDRPER